MSGHGGGLFAAQTLAFARLNLVHFVRSTASVVSVLLFPLLLMFVLLVTYGRIVDDAAGDTYVDRLASHVVVATVMFGATVTALAMVQDVRNGLLDRVRALPVSAMALLCGRVVGDVIRAAAVAGLVLAVAHLPGFRFRHGVLAAAGFFSVVLAYAVMVTWVGTLAGLVLSVEAIRALLSNASILMFLLSSGFVPADAFAPAVAPVIRANPMSAANDALLALSQGGSVTGPLLRLLAWVGPVSVVCAVAAVRRYRRLVD